MEKPLNKPVITQAQAEAIEKAWKMSGNKVFIIRMHDRDGSVLIDGREQLGDISTDTLIKALYIGYEVEPEFNKGDFVVWHGDIVQIKHPQTNDHKDDGRCYFTLEQSDGTDYNNIGRNHIRHATPSEIAEEKERVFFARHGRKPWELKSNDILYNSVTGIDRVWSVNSDGKIEMSKESKAFTIEEIKEKYKVACFVHERLDVNSNE